MSILYWLDQYVDVVQRLVADNVILIPLLLLLVEETGIPIIVPGDAIIAYTGYRLAATHGGSGFWAAFFMAQIAVLAGSTILFFVSRRWGQQIVDKIGAFIFVQQKHIRHAERLFARFGVLAIIIGRHIPGLRMPVTSFAATSGVKYRTFIISTAISTSVWILFYLTIGKSLGAAFHNELKRYVGLTFLTAALITGGVVVLHLIGAYRRKYKRSAQADAPKSTQPPTHDQ